MKQIYLISYKSHFIKRAVTPSYIKISNTTKPAAPITLFTIVTSVIIEQALIDTSSSIIF